MSRRERREREEREARERKKREKEEKKRAKLEEKIYKKRQKDKENNKKRNNKTKVTKKNTKTNKKSSKSKNKPRNKEPNFIVKILKFILKVILIIILIICLLAGILIGYLGVKTNWDKTEMLKLFAKETTLLLTGQTEEDLEKLKPIYCLVMGVSKDIDVSLTDTIMVCAYYPKTQQASILSIPRDTFIGDSRYSAGGTDKVNSVYASNGNDPEATLKEVEELTGLEINNYALIDTDALVNLVDEIGGVYFDVPINMKYDSRKQNLHINLKKGYQLIDGDKAEQLLRFRKNNDGTGYPAEYGSDDYGRMRTQREFITETIKQTLKLKNVTKLNDLVKIIFDNVDTNLDVNEVLKYVPAAVEFDIANIKSTALPGASERIGPQSLWFFLHDEVETEEIIDEMFLFNEKNEGNISIAPEDLTIQLLNGTGEEYISEDIKNKLINSGYNIKEEKLTTITKKSKLINRTNKSDEFSNELIDILKNVELKSGQPNDYAIDYTIIIGQDMI